MQVLSSEYCQQPYRAHPVVAPHVFQGSQYISLVKLALVILPMVLLR